MTTDEARDLARSGRVAVERYDGAPPIGVVTVDGHPIGGVVLTARGWFAYDTAGRLADTAPRSRRRTAVRRLLLSHPASTFDPSPIRGDG